MLKELRAKTNPRDVQMDDYDFEINKRASNNRTKQLEETPSSGLRSLVESSRATNHDKLGTNNAVGGGGGVGRTTSSFKRGLDTLKNELHNSEDDDLEDFMKDDIYGKFMLKEDR